jgi:hypothetical protein
MNTKNADGIVEIYKLYKCINEITPTSEAALPKLHSNTPLYSSERTEVNHR